MKVLGIVAEYNPFHNGHKFHIDKSKEISRATHTVCVMSGSLVQRGEFAIFNKWDRAKNALLNGADLVLELPAYYVLQSAQNFAYGAVKVLESLGVVDYLSFGSESGNIDVLSEISKIINGENKQYNDAFKNAISLGMGYPVARIEALKSLGKYDENIVSPNNLLGIYYIDALNKLDSKIKPITVKRHMTLHNDLEQNENFATASYIREKILNNDLFSDVKAYLPDNAEINQIFSMQNIGDYILGYLRFSDYDDDVPGGEEGISNYIRTCALKSKNLDEFFENCATKRYTRSRIKRVVLSYMLGIKSNSELDYVRVLGFNKKGAEIIKEVKEKSTLPIVVKTADFKPSVSSMFFYDIKATDLAFFSQNEKDDGMDYKKSPVIM